MYDANLMFADAQSLDGETAKASENYITIGDYDMSIGTKKPIEVQFSNATVTALGTASVDVEIASAATFATTSTLARVYPDSLGSAHITNLPRGSKGYMRLKFNNSVAFASTVTVSAGVVDQIAGSYHNQ